MSAVIDSKPTLIIPDNQPLIFTIGYVTTLPDRYVVQVFEDSVEIAKLYLTPNTNDKAHFDLSEIVRDRVKVDDKIRDESATLLSYAAKTFTMGRNGLKKYEVKVGTYTGTTETLDDDNDTVYLLDGAEQISAGLHPSFADYYPTGTSPMGWLTDRIPLDSVVTIEAREEDEGCVAFLNDTTIIGGYMAQIHYAIYNVAGGLLAEEYVTINVANGAQLPNASTINQKLTYGMFYPKNVNGWAGVGKAPEDNSTWDYYTIKIQSGSSATMSDFIKVKKFCGAVKHENTQLAWTNSRGGWDSLTFTGRTEVTDKATSKPFKKQVGNWDASTFTFLPEARESQPYQVTASTSYKLTRVDFAFTEIALLRYALRSDNVMIRQGSSGAWQPVNLDTKSFNVKEAFSGLFSISLTLTLAQDVKC